MTAYDWPPHAPVCPSCGTTVARPAEWVAGDTGTAPDYICATCAWRGPAPSWVHRYPWGDVPIESVLEGGSDV